MTVASRTDPSLQTDLVGHGGNPPPGTRSLSKQHLYFLFFVLACCVAFWTSLRSLILFSLSEDYGSHIILIAPISVYLIYRNRDQIFSRLTPGLLPGILLFLTGTVLAWAGYLYLQVHSGLLSVETLALIVLWISGFILCYGTHAFRIARFPLLFLLLMVPVPDFLLDRVIFFLQAGSATVAYWIFRTLNIPVLGDGFILRLPTLDLEVAKECSGIRSSTVLLITTLLVGEFALRSAWRKSLLVLSIVPIVILKNGVRIVSIALLTLYVNRKFLHGWLHQSGGMVFYLLGLLTLVPILMLLRRGEINRTVSEPTATQTGSPGDQP